MFVKILYSSLMIAAALVIAMVPNSVHAATKETDFEFCDGRSAFVAKGHYKGYARDQICYTVKPGDTLWGISEQFTGSGFEWKNLYAVIAAPRARNDHAAFIEITKFLSSPEKLEPGTRIAIQVAYVRSFEVSPNSKNTSWLVDTKPTGKSYCSRGYHGFRFVVNTKANPHYSCGWDYKLLAYSPNGENYAIRNNKGDGFKPEQFLVLSDIGNGPYYDYIDSIAWASDKTLIYRAQRGDVWRVVVNHVDQETFDYIDDVSVTDGIVSFRARHANGTWSQEKIDLN